MEIQNYIPLEKVALKLGCKKAKIIPREDIILENRVQFKCISCPYYGKKLRCPPYAPATDKFREILNEYKFAMVMNLKHPDMSNELKNELIKKYGLDNQRKERLYDQFQDMDKKSAMIWNDFSDYYKNMLMILLEIERKAFSQGYVFATAFFAGHCQLCEKCNIENEECTHPMTSRFSAEAMGINLLKTAQNAGMELKFSIGENIEDLNTFAIILID